MTKENISPYKICIIVPAYNEETNIEKVITSLNRCNKDWHIVIINDGSKDRTAEIAEATHLAQVIDLPCNLGIGGGVQTGFRYAKNNNFHIAVQFDGDGQHLASQIQKLILPIIQNEADVVIGSRFIKNTEKTFQSTTARRIGIKIFAILNSLLIKQKITDNTSGFRAYNQKAFHFLATNYPSDYPEPEAVILLGKNGFTMLEIPVLMKAREGGTSSIYGIRSIYYMTKVVLSVLIAAIRPAELKQEKDDRNT